jgi:hypothetical protein
MRVSVQSKCPELIHSAGNVQKQHTICTYVDFTQIYMCIWNKTPVGYTNPSFRILPPKYKEDVAVNMASISPSITAQTMSQGKSTCESLRFLWWWPWTILFLWMWRCKDWHITNILKEHAASSTLKREAAHSFKMSVSTRLYGVTSWKTISGSTWDWQALNPGLSSHLVRYVETVLYIQTITTVLLAVMDICHAQSQYFIHTTSLLLKDNTNM